MGEMTKNDNCFNWDDYITLREYFETKMNHLGEELSFKIAALKESTTIAKIANDERLERMNEFRDTLKDQAGTFVTMNEVKLNMQKIDSQLVNIRNEYCLRFDKVETDLRSLRESRAELRGKADQSQVNISLLIGVIGIIFGIIGIIKGFVG